MDSRTVYKFCNKRDLDLQKTFSGPDRKSGYITIVFNKWRRLTYLLTYLLTYSMEQSPSWEANWFAASQEIPRILWNPKVHYRIHKCPPLIPILNQLDRVHTRTSQFLKIHLNITLPSTPESPHWSLSLRFPQQNPAHTSPIPYTSYMPRPSRSYRFYTHTILGEEYRSMEMFTQEIMQMALCRLIEYVLFLFK